MKTQPVQSDSLRKALEKSHVFDEADYYQSKKVEMGGDEEVEEVDDEEDEEIDEGDDEE